MLFSLDAWAMNYLVSEDNHSVGKRHPIAMRDEDRSGFLMGITEALPTLKLTRRMDNPVWVDQFPLEQEKLSALKKLVKEQLQKGHIKQTNCPWNSPVFVIHKKTSNSWRLLHDLMKISLSQPV